ncbi:MAG TPA: hypothetical protein VK742_05375, partial [Candidatus Sulfotelmatobacter sp.]|nr:hypothetical protein [Candidatus Sulfotelmatobacter sp.]
MKPFNYSNLRRLIAFRFPSIFSLTPALSRWERVKCFPLPAKTSGWIAEHRTQKTETKYGCSLSQRALVSTQVRNGPFSGTFCRTLNFVNARFLAKNHAVLEYPSTCVDTHA